MAFSNRVSLFVLLAVICVATAHPVRSASKASIKKDLKLETSVKTNTRSLASNGKKNKAKATVRNSRSHDKVYAEVNDIRNDKPEIKYTMRSGSGNDSSDTNSSGDGTSDDDTHSEPDTSDTGSSGDGTSDDDTDSDSDS